MKRITWTREQTYDAIMLQYLLFIHNHSGMDNIVVVFDGSIDQASTKDTTHIRRSMGQVEATIYVALDTKKPTLFSQHKKNKQ